MKIIYRKKGDYNKYEYEGSYSDWVSTYEVFIDILSFEGDLTEQLVFIKNHFIQYPNLQEIIKNIDPLAEKYILEEYPNLLRLIKELKIIKSWKVIDGI